MQQKGYSETTSVLFLLALSLYLTQPTASSCLLYGAVTLFFCFETFSLSKLLLCELVFIAASVYVLHESRGPGYLVAILGLSAGQHFHGALRG